MRRLGWSWPALALAAGVCGATGPGFAQQPTGAPADPPLDPPLEEWRLLAEHRIPSGLRIDGVAFGGLSSLDYDAATDTFWAVSDDRAQRGPARAYRLKMRLDPQRRPSLALESLDVLGFLELQAPGGGAYAPRTIDAEAFRLRPGGGFYLASEGDAAGTPSVSLVSAEGAWEGGFNSPRHHFAGPDDAPPRGPRGNNAYEALAVLPDGRIAVGMESALHQDGPEATVDAGAPVRITLFDVETLRPVAEHIYPIEPVAARPSPSDGPGGNGLVALLERPEGGLYALERSFSIGQGTVVKLFLTGFEGATDVLDVPSLQDVDARPMAKRLLYTFQAGMSLEYVDNLEGLAFGPEIDGARTLVLISDDNFNRRGQFTQIIVLKAE